MSTFPQYFLYNFACSDPLQGCLPTSEVSGYLEHPPDSARGVDPKVGVVVVDHYVSVVADAHLQGRGVFVNYGYALSNDITTSAG